MSWPKAQQIIAERRWFMEACEEVGWKCNGSLISGRRTKARNATLPGAHPQSLHLEGLGQDWVFDTEPDYQRAWVMGREKGLHGYKKPASFGIHWQSRPAKRVSGP